MAEAPTAFNTHTLYNYHARELRKANEAITQTKKYLDPESPHYLPDYIAKLEEIQASDDASDEVAAKIVAAKANLESYQTRAEEAQAIIDAGPVKINELETSNNVFLSPPAKQNEYLYVLDSETCQASSINWADVCSNAGQVIEEPEVDFFEFAGKKDIELSGEHQTDAVRVWNHNVRIEGLKITDNRSYTDAHRDAIQLIPPPVHRFEDGVYIRMAAQMAGAILNNTTIEGCEVCAPNGPLQGIFASDGLYRDLRIRNNDIMTQGAHSISIAGLLNGGEISGNTLRQTEDGDLPKISLYPARIGGNMADDGVVSLLSFADNENGFAYEQVAIAGKPNRRVSAEGVEEDLDIDDLRHLLPDNYLKLAAGLTAFDYDAYLADYSSLTLGEYREHDPFGAEKMEEWLELRTSEFANGRESGHPLGPVSNEQKKIGERFLAPALTAMRDQSTEGIRLADLEYTAIRSFSMKRLAIMHGVAEPLIDIALLNERREQMLRFLLEPDQLESIARIAHIDGDMICNGSGLVIPYLRYSVFFAEDKSYTGSTDVNGRIELGELPLGPYILRLDDSAFSLAAANSPVTAPAELGTEAAGMVARSLLDDFQNKIPVVKAWMADNAENEVQGLASMRRYLSAKGVTPDSDITEEMRRDCLAVLGLGVSRREPYRRDIKVKVHCPQTNEDAGGCLFSLINFIKGLFGKK
uniref:Uncharacterized protein n=1 Tax=uncultured Thiotrichaceae bacterium TaxID=298394 RepID=A0A6S6SNU8_9GAMM|nr:MAG: Unknown protein [uncultured Thiotrichaceae bacterium]